MSAPERIWTTGIATSGSWNSTQQTSTRIDFRETEYTRADLHTAVVAERDALQAVQSYTYIGKDGKSVLARDLEDQRDALIARNAELQGALSKAEVEANGLRNERDALRDVAEKWIDLAKRHNSTHAMKMDANRLADFMQGIRETEAALARSAP